MTTNLTKAEEEVMQVLWKLDKAFLREIMDAFPEPKPHQNTVATVLKILVEKKFVAIKVFGRSHQYSARIAKEKYSQGTLKTIVKNLFEGSYQDAVSFMVKDNNISLSDLEMLVKEMKKKK